MQHLPLLRIAKAREQRIKNLFPCGVITLGTEQDFVEDEIQNCWMRAAGIGYTIGGQVYDYTPNINTPEFYKLPKEEQEQYRKSLLQQIY